MKLEFYKLHAREAAETDILFVYEGNNQWFLVEDSFVRDNTVEFYGPFVAPNGKQHSKNTLCPIRSYPIAREVGRDSYRMLQIPTEREIIIAKYPSL